MKQKAIMDAGEHLALGLGLQPPYHCYITARVPRVNCPDHGTKQVKIL
ncbi:hypothetical protein DFAR_2910029 [Desulfarculales bacterium]